jgi:predicted acylesterase/phospholipase RssA
MNAQPKIPDKECDIVMKGGITSGVVYPGAITRIAKDYRFRNLGGASAGAIAAVAAAACEYRRNQGDPNAFRVLDQVRDEISAQGFVLSLFQPTEEARPAFDLALRLVTTTGSLARRLFQAAVLILKEDRRFLLGAGLAVLVWIAIVVLSIVALLRGGPGALDIVAAILLGLVALPIAALIAAAFAVGAYVRFGTKLDRALRQTSWGMCSGRTEDGRPENSGLTDWLYQTVQKCAGNPKKALTFKDLVGADPKNADVNLQLITTDLSASRPATLPLPEPEEEAKPYYFDPEEWQRLFPEAVVERMVEATSARAVPDPHRGGRMLYPVPGLELPIVVAARLSLSFPILLSTVPFWRADGPDGEFVQHTMSDGGISSNFPIHYFDSLFPGRPTFGLDLQPWPGDPDADEEEFVDMSDTPRLPAFTEVRNVGNFFGQILNAARNWRDNMQAELPGYRDRICQIRLTATEGGLNLNMDDTVVKRLVKRGVLAGETVTNQEKFDWDKHRIIRFRTMMQMLQQSLGPLGFGRPGVYEGEYPGRIAFSTVVRGWQEAGASPEPPPFSWWTTAVPASDAVFKLVETWPDFDVDAPTPKPTLRIVPRA